MQGRTPERRSSPGIRSILCHLLWVMCSAPATVWSQAPAWSREKNVELVIGAGPGAAADATARTIQRLMQEKKLIPVSSVVIPAKKAGEIRAPRGHDLTGDYCHR